MKKLFTILCAGLLTLGVSAQTEAGNMMVGVGSNLGYSSFSPEGGGDATSMMNVGGSYGYFFMDNLAGIASFDYAKEGDDDAVTSFGIGARYYMNSFFAGAGYSVPGEEMSDITIGVGYAKMLTDNISLEPSLEYTMSSFDGEAYGSTIRLNIGFGLYF